MTKSLRKFLKKHDYIGVKLMPLKIAGNNDAVHFLIKARVNGKKGYFLLDTGASASVVDMRKAGKFRIKKHVDQPEINAVSASGSDLNVQLSTPNTVKIKSWKAKKVDLMLMDISHINTMTGDFPFEVDGIIGSDILQRGKAILDFDKKKLYLKLT